MVAIVRKFSRKRMENDDALHKRLRVLWKRLFRVSSWLLPTANPFRVLYGGSLFWLWLLRTSAAEVVELSVTFLDCMQGHAEPLKGISAVRRRKARAKNRKMSVKFPKLQRRLSQAANRREISR